MAIRRVFDDGNFTQAYGSFGTIVSQPNFKTMHDMRDEIPYFRPYLPTIIGDFELAYAHMITCAWRWKYAFVSADLPVMQTYNGVTNKRRHGTCLVEKQGYVCDEQFVSFDAQISPIYRASYVLVLGSGEYDLPCDEPPSDSEVAVVSNAHWIAGTYSNIQTHLSEVPCLQSGMLGEAVTFYPELAITGYIFGGSFWIALSRSYTQSQYETEFGRPVAINL